MDEREQYFEAVSDAIEALDIMLASPITASVWRMTLRFAREIAVAILKDETKRIESAMRR